MSAYATKPESRNIAATSKSLAGTRDFTLGEAHASSALRTVQDMQDQLETLKTRLQHAMDAIAVACNAERCPECHSWTTATIPFGEGVYCSRCTPPEYCPF